MRTYRPQRNAPYTGNDPQLMEPDNEPSAHQWDAARSELGPWASDAQVERRALQLVDEEQRLWATMSDDDEADSRLDDKEYWR